MLKTGYPQRDARGNNGGDECMRPNVSTWALRSNTRATFRAYCSFTRDFMPLKSRTQSASHGYSTIEW